MKKDLFINKYKFINKIKKLNIYLIKFNKNNIIKNKIYLLDYIINNKDL